MRLNMRAPKEGRYRMPYEECGRRVSRGGPARGSGGETEGQHLRSARDRRIVGSEGPVVRERAHTCLDLAGADPSFPTETFTVISPLRSGLYLSPSCV